MPIAEIDAVLTVTPHDEIQVLHAGGNFEFVDDRTPFTVRVTDIMREDGAVIGVVGPVVDGPDRYSGMTATLLTRLDGSRWETDFYSQASFRIGRTEARRVAGYPHNHPLGTVIEGYPQMIRFGSVEANPSEQPRVS